MFVRVCEIQLVNISIGVCLLSAVDGGGAARAGPVRKPVDDPRDARAVPGWRPVHCTRFPWRLRDSRAISRPRFDRADPEVYAGQNRAHRELECSSVTSPNLRNESK